MVTRTLLILLLTVSMAAAAPGDNTPDDPRASKAPGYVPVNRPATKGLVWANIGYGIVDSYFNSDAQAQELGSGEIPGLGRIETNAQIALTVLHLGGSYTVSQIGAWDVNLGADLGLANQTMTADAIPGIAPGIDLSSGLSPQSLTLMGELTSANYTIRTGFLADLNRELDTGEIATTDRQHAILLGVAGEKSFQSVRLFGGVDYFLTLPNEQLMVGGLQLADRGDLVSVNVGAGVHFQALEVGLTAIYRINTKSSFEAVDQLAQLGAPNEFASGSVFSLAPYITFAPSQLPVRFFVKGALQREYYDYGFALSGSNDIAPRLGGSFGLIYAF